MSRQTNAKVKLCSMKYGFILYSLFSSSHGVIRSENSWNVCSSNLVTDLLSTWYSNLAEAQVPWLYLVRHTHQHIIFVKTCGLHAFFSSFFPVFLFISTPPPPSFPPSLSFPWILWRSEARRRHESHGDRQKHFYQWDPSVRCLWM